MFTACHSVRRLTVNVAGINPVRTAVGQRRDGADSAVCVLFINPAGSRHSVRLSHRSCSDNILTELRVGSQVVIRAVQFAMCPGIIVMHRITTFRSTTDHIYYGGPIIL